MLQQNHPPIKTYVKRQSRITQIQQQALKELWPFYGLESQADFLNYEKIFQRDSARILEIGFGMGHALVEMAKRMPENDFIGIEVHLPGVGAVLTDLEKYNLRNVRIFKEDALQILKQCIPDESIDKILIFFPDPWPKRRHHKRRIVQIETIKLIKQKLKKNGILHLATDWEEYAMQMLQIISADKEFVNRAGENKFSLRPDWRPLTKFEKRGEKLGYQIRDLIFQKQSK